MTTTWIASFNRAVLRRKARVFSVALLLLTILGPFGTYESFDVAGRLIYWSMILIFAGLIFEISVPGFLYNPVLARKISRWPRFVLGVLTGSFFAVWVVIAVEYITRGAFNLTLLPWLFVYVATIASVICFVSFMPPFANKPATPDATDINFERIAFFHSYPHLKGSRIRWITMEDHYARLVLDGSEVTLHTSMRDLEQQLENYPGMRVHRSHWVANDAIRGINRNGRAMMIDVGDNQKLPLGGTYQKQVEAVFAEMQAPK